MPSEILTLADALTSDLLLRITITGGLDTTVTREYEVTHDMGAFTGRKVEVFPVTYEPVDDASRAESVYEFMFSIVVMERYRLKGSIPKAWIDERVNFVEEYIFNPYDVEPTNVRRQPRFLVVGGVRYWVEDIKVTSVFDFDFLKQHRVFWSEVEVTFRRISAGL